jgi:hypothetical protein
MTIQVDPVRLGPAEALADTVKPLHVKSGGGLSRAPARRPHALGTEPGSRLEAAPNRARAADTSESVRVRPTAAWPVTGPGPGRKPPGDEGRRGGREGGGLDRGHMASGDLARVTR